MLSEAGHYSRTTTTKKHLKRVKRVQKGGKILKINSYSLYSLAFLSPALFLLLKHLGLEIQVGDYPP